MPTSILANANKKNVHLYLKNGDLAYKAPKGAIDNELRNDIINNKAEIIGLLKILEESEDTEKKITKSNTAELALSFSQQGLWLLDQIDGGSSHYNMSTALKLSGTLNFNALEKAFISILDRHEVLRICFKKNENGQPLPVIKNSDDFAVILHDLSHIKGESKLVEVIDRITLDEAHIFNLNTDFMLKVQLLKLSNTEHVMLLNMHHIASDGWSIGILFKELSILYKANSLNYTNPLQPLSIQYTDYAQWQRDWLQGVVLDEQLSYWCKQLADLPLLHNLPLDNARPVVQSFSGKVHKSTVNKVRSDSLKDLCRAHNATMFMGLHAVFSVLLARYSNETDIVIGSPIANREQAEITSLIGFFMNNLVLRSDLSGAPTFNELIKKSKQLLLAAYAHQKVPFEQVVEALKPERNLSHTPLFQVMMVLQNNGERSLELSDIKTSEVEQERKIAKYDLTLTFIENDQGLSLEWEYNSRLFNHHTIAQLAGHFDLLVNTLTNEPDQDVFKVQILSENQQYQQLQEWNDVSVNKAKDSCIHDLFEAQVEKDPNAVAVVFEGSKISYGDLNQRANQLACYLIKHKQVKPDSLVGICIERSLEMIVGILAILKAGAAYVPLDPEYPNARLEYMLVDADLTIVLTQLNLDTPIDNNQGVYLDDKNLLKQLSAYPTNNIARETLGLKENHLAYVVYTSGSTGQPKGVMVEHGQFSFHISNSLDHYSLTGSDRVLQFATMNFDAAQEQIFVALASGASLYIRSNSLWDAKGFYQYCCHNAITVADLPPSYCLDILYDKSLAHYYFTLLKLRILILGGESLNKEILKLWRALPSTCQLINAYGPTEAVITSCSYQFDKESNDNRILIGRAHSGRRNYLLKEGELVPVGVTAELHLGGKGLARGYLNREKLTKEKFILNPFYIEDDPYSTEVLYKTGDLVRWLPDGNLEFLGRIDEQVKIRGFRIELGEITHALVSHHQISDALVLVKTNEIGEKYLVAYVTTGKGKQKTQEDDKYAQAHQKFITSLREHLAQYLPAHMLPSSFVLLEYFQFTPSGKIDRKALPEPGLVQQKVYVAPLTEIEKLLCNIWQEVLGLDCIGITDNFFELGGHSLLATRMVAKINHILNVKISLKTIFSYQTIGALSVEVSNLDKESQYPTIVNVPRDQDLTPSFSQQRLWLLDQLDNGSTHYNMAAALRLTGTLNVSAIEEAFISIVERHEALRTCFAETDDGKLIQTIQTEINFKLVINDLSHLLVSEQLEALTQHIQNEASFAFDLSRDLMLRVKLFQISTNEHVLSVTMHHIASDGWSVGILISEFSDLYEAYSQGFENPLLPLKIQYADYAKWQRDWLQGEFLQSKLAYWTKQLANLPLLHSLPLDKKRPPIQNFIGKVHQSRIANETNSKLQTLCQQQGVTLFMGLHAVFSVLLSRYSNETDIVIGSPIANREQLEIAPLIGFFVNNLVLRSDLSTNPNFNDLLKQSKHLLLDAYEHQQVPFEQIIETLQPDRSLSYSPLFQVMLVLQNNAKVEIDLPGISINSVESQRCIAKYDLTLNIFESEKALVLEWQYNTDLFNASTIEQMAGHFDCLVSSLTSAPEQDVFKTKMLSEAEEHQQLVLWNNTSTNYVHDKCIHELFEIQVQKNPDSLALVFDGLQLSYKELNRKANKLANYLIEVKFVRPDTLVGIYFERSAEMVIGILAILKAGGAYVPLDPNYPEARLNHMIQDADLSIVLTSMSLCETIKLKNNQAVCLDDSGLLQSLKNYSEHNISSEQLKLKSQHLAYVIFTSGSTGLPKGVLVQHNSLVNLICFDKKLFELKPSSKLLNPLSIGFDAGNGYLWGALCAGAQLHLVEGTDCQFNLIKNKQITHAVVSAALLNNSNVTEIDSLEVLMAGGDVFNKELINQLGTQTKLFNLYGPTENTVTSTYSQVMKDKPLSIGKPVANVSCYILNRGSLSAVGVAGELHLGGVGLARGYLNQPDLTAQKFIKNPFYDESDPKSSKRLYKTGDLVRWLPNGNLEFLGRIDHQVKVRGFRIELGEIENILSVHEAVKNVVVIVKEHATGDKRIVVYITTDNPCLINDEVETSQCNELIASFRNHLKKSLPNHMMPSEFILLASFPLTPNGKVDRKALPDPKPSHHKDNYIEPKTEIEKNLCKIWQGILELEHIGITDNFFELGGHSLSLIRLKTEIKAVFQLDIAINILYARNSVVQQADFIEAIALENNEPELKLSSELVEEEF